jgi:hypothetical protein
MAHFVTPVGTLSFPHLFIPKPKTEAPGAKRVYSCSILFDAEAQQSPEFKALEKALVDTAKAKHGDKINLKTLSDWPIRDAAQKEYAGYGPGMVYISPWTNGEDNSPPPGIVDGRLQKVLDPSKVYAGALVRANVTPFGWTFSGKKGVSFGLNHIQLVDTSTPRIDGRVAAEKAFSPLEQLEDEDSPI